MKTEKLMVREKALEYGFVSLTDSEIMGLAINSIIPSDCKIGELAKSNINDLIQKGFKKQDALRTLSLIEIAKRLIKEEHPVAKPMCNPEEVVNYMKDMRFLTREEFRVLFLDSKKRLIKEQIMTIGTSDSSLVSVRDVCVDALKLDSKCIIAVHNHPEGDEFPSEADFKVTNSLKEACSLVGLNFIDHIIISQQNYYSFRERGTM